ncbi:hypothetical protein F5Y17DRAFT_456808 [Xylariaceae sp. FL0594]|nr:hypothetical protein F5Y17DRAFT_456808 [Xylariaceae sp. FL0594]
MSQRSGSEEAQSPSSSSVKAPSPQSTFAMRDGEGEHDSSSKRKRTFTNEPGPASSRRRNDEPEFIDDGEESDQYDPDQPIEERRELQRGYRELLRSLQENSDKVSEPSSMFLFETIEKANVLSHRVKQTGEATIDAKFLLASAEFSLKTATRLVNGNAAQGIDVDEFVSKCISYMRLGAGIAEDDGPGLTMTQQQRRRPGRNPAADSDDEDDIGDDGDMMNWEHLGRFACVPNIRRPAVPGFLLGPLSVEKKVRKVVKRSAPFRPDNLRETRPEVLKVEDVQRLEQNDLTAICAKILRRLEEYQDVAQKKVEEAFTQGRDTEAHELMGKYGLHTTGGIDLLKFVVNPKSFGQTVENMFYISFLIRDGRVEVEFDEEGGLPSLQPIPLQESEGRKPGAQRHQAVFSIDMALWQDIIDAFDITEPIIEHRKEQSTQGPGARGWYS